MDDESIPPESATPTGTSAMRLRRTLSKKSSRTWCEASEKETFAVAMEGVQYVSSLHTFPVVNEYFIK